MTIIGTFNFNFKSTICNPIAVIYNFYDGNHKLYIWGLPISSTLAQKDGKQFLQFFIFLSFFYRFLHKSTSIFISSCKLEFFWKKKKQLSIFNWRHSLAVKLTVVFSVINRILHSFHYYLIFICCNYLMSICCLLCWNVIILSIMSSLCFLLNFFLFFCFH